MESIRRYARLNERNVNHKKLRAFKSPTRWCTFALITLHLSFLPRASLSAGGGLNPSEKRTSFLLLVSSPHLSHSLSPSLSLSRSVLRLSSFARSLICIPRKRISLGPFRESLSFSFSTFLFPLTPNGSSFARGNSPPRIDHLPDRTLLGIISYVAVPHSRSDMRCVPRRRTRRERRIGRRKDEKVGRKGETEEEKEREKEKRRRERETGIERSESWKNHTYTLHGRY